MFRSLIMVLLASLWLSGCGGMRLVDSEVRSFASAPPVPAGARYRFERLPSQQADAAAQAQLEALAQQALAKVGLQHDEAAPSYSVQVTFGLRVDRYSPWLPPENGWGPGWNPAWGRRGSFAMMMEPPYYWRQLSLILRDLHTQQLVYETHAAHDGPWADTAALLPAMLDAALQGFPNPPPGPRRITIEIPR
jgi:hypothetical protein